MAEATETASMKVKVSLPDSEYGIWNNSRVKAGTELTLTDPRQFSVRWMAPCEPFPASWTPTRAMCKVKGEFALANPAEALKAAEKQEKQDVLDRAKRDAENA